MTGPRLRISCYVAGLTGLGHYARMATLAGELATAHDVTVVNAGRGSAEAAAFAQVDLPPLPVTGGRVQVPGVGHSCWAARAETIRRTVEATGPHVVVVEHYPFSKWELGPEIETLLATARSANPTVVLLASVRDIVGRTQRERIGEADFAAEVVARIEAFDGLLVHGDPDLLPLEASFAAANRLPVPVHPTGYVVDLRATARRDAGSRAGVLVAAGGGADQGAFLEAAVPVAEALAADGAVEVFRGPFGEDGSGDVSRARYLEAMGRSAAAVTRAGYNTTVELWAASVPTVLVPDRRMSDQAQRAAAFSARGAGIVLEEPELSAGVDALRERLADAIRTRGAIDIDGARRTRELVEELARR